MKKIALLIVIFAASACVALHAQDEARLLRFPAIHGNSVVFSYAGDLYTVGAEGGVARKLTNDVGYEMWPRFSPDGKNIAFTAQYDGNTEVYLMPAGGGVPKRLTVTPTLGRDDVSDRMGPNNIVMGWKDNNNVIFRSRMREFNDFIGQLYLISIEGGLPEQLPFPRGGFCSYSPDGKKFVYNRIFREFRTWKRYRGGMADDIWIYDFASKKTENITNNNAQDIIPMWAGNKIYFLSDRDSRMNLFSYDLATKETKKLTNFADFDIKFPSLGDNAIVFENGGYIYKFDLATEKAVKIPIQIREDLDGGRGGLISVSKNITNYEISPDGKRALFGARGDVFTVPAEKGITRNITNTPGVHERNSKWSPDGKWIAYISDATGEDEIWLAPQDGKGEAVQLTKNGDTYKYQPYWSPDSKKLLWADRKQRLNWLDVDSKNTTVVTECKAGEIGDYKWAPDSKWITYTTPEIATMSKVYIHSIESEKTITVTDGWYTASDATFSEDGKYLFFVSSRNFNPTLSWIELENIYTNMAQIYFVTLEKKTESLLKPENDEVAVKEEKKNGDEEKDAADSGKKDKDKKSDKKKDKGVEINVDADGIVDRIAELPVKPAAYGNLESIGDALYYVRYGDGKPSLCLYDFKKRKETELGEYGGYEISADKKKMMIGSGGSYGIIDLPKGKIKIDDDEKVNTSDMKASLDRHAEWTQIFNECWRQMKYFLYDPNLHGVDWNAMKKNYGQLVPYVNHRADLTYVIGEMIGELNIGHAYVGGGEKPEPQRIKLGLLGAELSRDKSGNYRIEKIMRGENWYNNLRSPLTEIGVDVKQGDYIVSIDGVQANKVDNIYELLIDKAGKQVELTVSDSPGGKDSRTSLVIPTDNEQGLYYFNWVQNNLRTVSEKTNGRVGYIHVPDMGIEGLNEFVKYYYPQLMKEALIIDMRGNGGGFVSPMIMARLSREAEIIGLMRGNAPRTSPGGVNMGPKVCLLNEYSASDGDIFPYRFKTREMGKLIGKRSWGGTVGIRGTLPLLDGGYLNRPEFAHYSIDGKEWAAEGHGVDPDIVVDNDPATEFAGTDQQLDRAIEEIMKDVNAGKGFKLPPPPPFPNKSK